MDLPPSGFIALGALALLMVVVALLRVAGASDPASDRPPQRPPQPSTLPEVPPQRAIPPPIPAGVRPFPGNASDETILALLAAHSSGDAAFLRRVGVAYGLVDPRTGHPVHEGYVAYTEAVKRVIASDMERYARFCAEAQGDWRAWAERRLEPEA